MVVGVITAIAINLVNQYLQQNAVLAARAEVQKLLLAATANTQNPTEQNPVPTHSPTGYANIT